jgi:hypothetical protein
MYTSCRLFGYVLYRNVQTFGHRIRYPLLISCDDAFIAP